MAKKPTRFMKEQGRGYLRIWHVRTKEELKYRTLWTDGRVIFFDTHDHDFVDLPVGCYRYQSGNFIKIKQKEMPDIRGVIPSQKGYRTAELPFLDIKGNVYLQVLIPSRSGNSLIKLTAKTKKSLYTYIRYDFFEYLNTKIVLDWCEFKIKSPEDPVLVFYEKELKAVIMPVKIEG